MDEYSSSQISKLSMAEVMDVDGGAEQPFANNEEAICSTSLQDGSPLEIGIPPRKGRARSGAMTSPNKRFFMGYVPDCDKCRLKVPGHSVHILPA